MKRGDLRAAGIALAALFAAASAQAQDVHKCTVDGAVSYQSTPCTSGDVVLQAPPTPSEQETRQARTDLWRQHVEAVSGRLVRPAYVPPRPPPPPPLVTTTTTTTTTIFVQPSAAAVIVRQTTSRSRPALPQKPLTHCETLDRDNTEAVERREQVRVATDMPSHAQALQKAEDDAARIRQLAAAGNCRPTR